MSLNEYSAVEDVYQWLIEKGVSQETSQIFKGKIHISMSLTYVKNIDFSFFFYNHFSFNKSK